MCYMKKYLFALISIVLVVACAPEENKINEPGGDRKDKSVHVTSISLDRSSASIKEGETISLVATLLPDNADNKVVVWSSSSEAVATVDASGKVTGVRAGIATIAATAADGGMKATCTLNVEANFVPVVTVGADHISAVSVELQGRANVDNKGASVIHGFQYYKVTGLESPTVTTILSTSMDAANNYTVTITELEPSTTYSYWSFIRQNGKDIYGDMKEFTTKDVTSLLETEDASGVEATKATLNAKLDLTDVQYKSITYGFLWGSSESSLNTELKCSEIKDNAYAAPLTGLSHKRQYWYKAFVKVDGQTFEGEDKSFTTDVVPVESITLYENEYTFHAIGSTWTLRAKILPEDATDKSVEWSSDNENVATVSAGGIVRSVGNGSATITATTVDQKKTASCTITVEDWEITDISLLSRELILSMDHTDGRTLKVTINPSYVTTQMLTVNPLEDDDVVSWSAVKDGILFVPKKIGTTSYKIGAKYGPLAATHRQSWVIVKTVSPEDYSNYEPKGNGTQADPYNSAGVVDYIKSLSSTPSANEVYIRGKVIKIERNFTSDYGTATFWISVDGALETAFKCNSVKFLENNLWVNGNSELDIDDEVVVCSRVTNYNGNYTTLSDKGYVYSLNGLTTISAAGNEIDFTKAPNKGTPSESKVEWENDYITVTLTKGTSSTPANNYLGGTNAHTRVYRGQVLSFAVKSGKTVKSIVLEATSSDYAKKSLTWTDATATVAGANITATPSEGKTEFSAVFGEATRFNKLTVNVK